jgi:pantothenate kinase
MSSAAATKPETRKPFMLNFRDDTLTTVSRATVKTLSEKLGFNETQTVLYALARLRDEVVIDDNVMEMQNFKPLSKKHHTIIARAEPKARGRVISTLLP